MKTIIFILMIMNTETGIQKPFFSMGFSSPITCDNKVELLMKRNRNPKVFYFCKEQWK